LGDDKSEPESTPDYDALLRALDQAERAECRADDELREGLSRVKQELLAPIETLDA
jgi:hypothetical protein